MRLSPEQQNDERKIIEIKLPVEKTLIEESGEDPSEWIKKYGEQLDEILRDPELKKLFDQSRHDELKQKIKERLYH